ncbi:MAG: TonB-dependent siderophore receptor [Pseudoxanthomonas sp.]
MNTVNTQPPCRLPPRHLRTRLAVLSVGCTLALAQMALAQESDNSGTPSVSELDKIVVVGGRAQTGTKTDTALTEIPQSISVVSAEQFTERAAVNFQDIFRYSAGVATAPNGVDARGDAFTARGFNTVQYLDGLNRMPDFIYGARMEVFTLERAEVLRGPSSVLYGAGGSGGLFNGVSKLPQQQFGGEVGLSLGNFDRQELRFDVTGPIGDQFAGRVVALARDGELQWEGQADDRKLLMPSLTWNIGERTNLTLLGLYQKDEMGTQTYLPLALTDGAASDQERLPHDFFLGDKGFNRSNIEHKSASLLFDHAFSDNIKFSSRTRRYEQDVDYAEVYATGIVPGSNSLLSREFYVLGETYKGLNSDSNVAFTFGTGPFEHRLLAGIDYIRFEQDRQEGFSCAGLEGLYGCYAGGSPPPIDVNDPNYYADFDFGYTNAYTTRSTQLGFYVQDQIRYRDKVSLMLGARRDKATSQVSGVSEPDATATTYRVGVIGEVGAGISPYVSYSESFQPVFGGDYYGNPFSPREGRQYEAGIKWEVNRYSLITLSAFDIEESNYVVQDPDFIQNFIQTGKVGSKGVELEANLRFGSLDVNAAWSYTDAEVLSATDGTQGNRVADLPKHLASLWVTKAIQLSDDVQVRFGGGARYTGSKLDTNQIYTTDAVTVADAMVEVGFDRWTVSLNASNIFDKQYYSYCTMSAPPNGTCYTSSPRMFLANLRYRF